MIKTYILISLIIFSINIYSEEVSYNNNNFSYGSVIDTVEVGDNTMVLKFLWKNDTIQIIRRKYIEPTLDDTNLDKIKDHNNLFAIGQNCHSYALELYFRANGHPEIEVFNSKTTIHNESYKKVLETSFELIQEFNVVRRKKIVPKVTIENKSLLVFYNHSNMISHSVYYENEIFYTKNGLLKPSSASKIIELLKPYWDTKYIRVYSMKENN